MKISKIRDVKLPTRGTLKSAGIDFYIPKFNDNFKKDFKGLVQCHQIFVSSGDRILIPSGIKVDVPKGYMLTAFNKSGISTKKGLLVGACVVDEGYQGEVHISLFNSSNLTITLEEDEKIVQFILIPVFYDVIEEVDIENLYPYVSERGDGGFGSTNK